MSHETRSAIVAHDPRMTPGKRRKLVEELRASAKYLLETPFVTVDGESILLAIYADEMTRAADELATPTAPHPPAPSSKEPTRGVGDDFSAARDLSLAACRSDLEFRSDDRADEGWEHRCRRALTAYKIVRGQLVQRIARLGRAGAKAQWQHDEERSQTNKERSLRNREVQEQASANALERKRQLIDAARLDVERKRLELARKLSFLHVFRGVAFDLLPRETYDQLSAEAASRQSSAVLELAGPEPAKESA